MNPRQTTQRSLALIPAFLLALLVGAPNHAFAGWDYGNGRHGYFVLTTNATIEQLYQTVRLPSDPAQYDATNSNAIPNFQNLIITNGATLTANSWVGSAAGKIVLKAEARLDVAAGSYISVNSIGYRGGGSASQGESFGDSANPQYGGGGGSRYSFTGFTVTGAGGGGYGSAGGDGTCFTYNAASYCSVGGASYGTAALDSVFLGSGGGGGAIYGNNGPAQNGGNGGGVIIINAGQLQVTGQIQANGGAGGTGIGGAGGGSGGSIQLRTVSAILGNNNVTANGGNGGLGSQNNGGNGGSGRIMIGYATTYTGATTPAAYSVLDTNSDNITVITNQPASQTHFWSSNAVINVGFSGYPPIIFQWYFNSTPISGATNQTLALTGLDFTNQGNYSVTVSNAVMTVASSNAFLTILDGRDFDGDGIPNYWEHQYSLDQNNPNDATNHPPGDLLTYLQKYFDGLNPLTLDTDGDGLNDHDELFIYGTSPLKANTSDDGIPDGWKVQHGLNPLIANANDEITSSGVNYWQVYQYNLAHTNQLDPRSPFFATGASIYEVANSGQHTNRFYYDKNDRLTGGEYSKGISISYQYDRNDNLVRQTVLSRLSETNALPVLWLFQHGFQNTPNIAYQDSDGDGWSNYQEWKAGTDPLSSDSIPNPAGNPGEIIAAQGWPFTPSNFVMGTGQLDGLGTEEIVVGADGDPGTTSNFLLVLAQGALGWTTERVDVGPYGVTSVTVGQPTNRPNAGIYVGLRGATNGASFVMEFTKTGGIWQSNVVALSTNEAAIVGGIRPSGDLLANLATNGMAGALWSLTFSNTAWNVSLISSNASHRGIPNQGQVFSHNFRESSLRLLDAGGIEVNAGIPEFYKDDILLPQGLVLNPATGKWHFSTPSAMGWDSSENYFASFHGHLTLPRSADEDYWLNSHYPGDKWLGLYFEPIFPNPVGDQDPRWYPHYADKSSAPYGINANTAFYSGYRNWSSAPNEPDPRGSTVFESVHGNGMTYWDVGGGSKLGVGEILEPISIFTNRWTLTAPDEHPIYWPGALVVPGSLRPGVTNSSSIMLAAVADRDQSGSVDTPDMFVFAEYQISNNTVVTTTLTNIPVGSSILAQSFCLAAVDFLNSGANYIFTAEPNGGIYSWSTPDASSLLKRQVFTEDYLGKGWHALAGVGMAGGGQGLAGLMIDPTNRSTCSVILWPSRPVLRPLPKSVPQTPPLARLLPFPNSGGNLASVGFRLWDSEGNPATIELQYRTSSGDWKRATLSASGKFATLPIGVTSSVNWNALADLHESFNDTVSLRMRASDFDLGPWSESVPYRITTSIPPLEIAVGTEITDGTLTLRWTLPAGKTVSLETSEIVGPDADWQPVSDFIPGSINYSVPVDASQNTRFFRLRIQ